MKKLHTSLNRFSSYLIQLKKWLFKDKDQDNNDNNNFDVDRFEVDLYEEVREELSDRIIENENKKDFYLKMMQKLENGVDFTIEEQKELKKLKI